MAGEPLIRRILQLARGARRAPTSSLNLHHLPRHDDARSSATAAISALRVRYSWEQPQVLGSAGGPRQALAIIGADTFLIVNGDTLTDVDLDGARRGASLDRARWSRWR